MKKQNNASKRIIAAVLAILSFAGTANYPAVADLFQPSSITASAQGVVMHDDTDLRKQIEEMNQFNNSKPSEYKVLPSYIPASIESGSFSAANRYDVIKELDYFSRKVVFNDDWNPVGLPTTRITLSDSYIHAYEIPFQMFFAFSYNANEFIKKCEDNKDKFIIIRLVKDVDFHTIHDLEETIKNNSADLYIDLNGHKWVCDNETKEMPPVFVNTGKLTIFDSTDEKKGIFTGFGKTIIKNEKGGVVNILDGIFEDNNATAIENNGTLNIYGGHFTNNSIKGNGLIVNEGSGTVNFYGGLFNKNSADNGAIVYAKGGKVNFVGGRFEENLADAKGGVFAQENEDEVLNVTGCDFINNRADQGGCFAVTGKASIKDAHIMNCSANNGGAVYAENNADVTAKDSLFYGCWAVNNGGAVCVYRSCKFTADNCKLNCCSASENGGAVYTLGTTVIDNSEMIGNNAKNGGVVCVNNGTAKISKSKASQNEAVVKGSVVCNNGKEVQIIDNEFTNNGVNDLKQETMGTVYVSKGSTASIRNNKFNGNYSKSGSAVYTEGTTSLNNCVVVNNTAFNCGTVYVAGGKADVTGCEFTKNNVSTGSVLYSANKDNEITISNTKANICNGSNIASVGGHITMHKVDITGNVMAIQGAVCLRNTTCEMNGCLISNCSANRGAAITARERSFVTVTNTDLLNNKANNGGAIYAEASGVKVVGGNINGNFADEDGSAIASVNGAKVDVFNVTINKNSAKNGSVYVGGSANVVLSGGVIKNNEAAQGAGVYNEKESTVTVDNVQFANNKAQNKGAGIYNEGTAEILGGSFEKNSAFTYGGAVYNTGKLNVKGGVFTENNANEKGGAIFNSGDNMVIDGEKTSFVKNNAVVGGAIYNQNAKGVVITNASFNGNFTNKAEDKDTMQTVKNSLGIVGPKIRTQSNGGAIYNDSGEIKITGDKAKFDGNKAEIGGAVFSAAGKLEVNGGVVFKANEAEESAGAVMSSDKARLNIDGAIFDSNKAAKNGGALVIRSNSALDLAAVHVIAKSEFRNNNAAKGGAVYICHPTKIEDTNFSGNKATDNGGAILTVSKLDLSKNTFTANVAGSEFTTGTNGGAIFSTDTQAITDEGSVFTSNRSNLGGAVCHYGDPKGASDVFKNTVFKDNIAENGGAVYTKAGVDFYNADISFNTAQRDAGAVYHFGTLGIYNGTRILNNRAFANGGANVFGEGLTTIAPVKVKGKVFVSQNNDKNGSSNVKLSGHESILVQGDITGSAICVSSADDLKFTVDYEKYMKDNDPAQFFIADEEGGKISYHEFEAYKNQIIGSFKDAKLTIDNAISLRVFINFTKDLPADKLQYAYVLVKGASYGTKGEVVKVVKDENGKYYIDLPLAAKYMSDQINLDLYYNDVLQASKSTSIREYANTILSDASYKDAHELVKAMLNYGAKAQILFNQNTTESAIGDRFYKSEAAVKTADVLANEPKYINFVKPESIKGLSFNKTTLELESEIKQRQYFTLENGANINDYTFYINNQVVKPIANGKNTYFIVTGETRLCDLAKAVDFKVVCNKAAGEMSFSCSPMDYIANAIKNGDSKDVKTQRKIDTCRALFWYYNELVSFNGGSIAGKTADI